jgi:hypothetical protein
MLMRLTRFLIACQSIAAGGVPWYSAGRSSSFGPAYLLVALRPGQHVHLGGQGVLVVELASPRDSFHKYLFENTKIKFCYNKNKIMPQ